MKNTLENKAKFFALYWGQKILRYSFVDRQSPYAENTEVVYLNGAWFGEAYLELKPLSQITDEDAIEVSKLCVYGDDTRIGNIKEYARIYAMQSSVISDYLRSKGYALPWMVISVEEQIEFGWVKLKE